MSAVLLWTRTLWRQHWRATVVVGLVVGFAGGAAMGSWEYSRRAGSAVDRWVEAVRPADADPEGCPRGAGSDVAPGECFGADVADTLYRALEDSTLLGGIETTAALPVVLTAGTRSASTTMGAVVRSRGEIDVPFVVSGRSAATSSDAAVSLTSSVADALGVGVGDVVGIEVCDWPFVDEPGPCTSFGDVRVAGLVENLESLHATRAVAPGAIARIAGRGVVASGPGWEQWSSQHVAFTSTTLNFRRGVDADQVTAELSAALPDHAVRLAASDQSARLPGLRRSVDLEAAALRALAVIMAAIAFVFSLQVLMRQTRREMHDRDIVRSLGGGRSIPVRVAALRTAPTAAIAGLVAGCITIAASMFGPGGVAGRLETDRGARVDMGVIAVGATAIVLGAIGMAAATASVTPRTRRLGPPSSWAGRAASISTIVRAGLSLAGAGRRQFVWPAAVAVAVAVVMGGVASSLSGNLGRTMSTPVAFGASWEYGLTSTGVGGLTSDEDADAAMEQVLSDPAVASASFVVWTVPRQLDGTSLFSAFAFMPVQGSIDPVIVEGRAPVTGDEVAVGPRTLDELELDVGDQLAGLPSDASDGTPTDHELVGPWTIVGVALLNNDNERVGPGRGVLVTEEGMQRLVDEFDEAALVVTADASLTPVEAVRHFSDGFGPYITVPSPQEDITNLIPLTGVAWAIQVFLTVLAAAVVFHAVVSCVALGRRQLATLRALGFRSSQLRWSVVALSGLVTIPAAAVGIGAAALSGRWAWAMVSDRVGLVSATTLAMVTIVLVTIVVVGLAVAVAAVPAWRSAGDDVAEGLRSE